MSMIIDLRSDTVTLQPEEMKEAMMRARVGDEYYDSDPTILELQALSAEIMGKEAGLFVASGTMGNLVSILSHTQKSEMMIMEATSHCFRCEVAHFAVAGGVIPKQVPGRLGVMSKEDLEAALPVKGYAFPIATLVLVENTHNAAGGTCITPQQMAEYREVADRHNLRIHVDGARIFNAAVALGVKPSELAKDADSLTFCLSKGLAAPFGAVVVGSKDFISRARRYKQMVGGGFRQAGYLAAAGIYALNHMVDRLAEDHQNAKLLAEGLTKLGFIVDHETVQTNMVFFDVPPSLIDADLFAAKVNEHEGILMNSPNKGRIRLVTHYGIEKQDVTYFLDVVAAVLKKFGR